MTYPIEFEPIVKEAARTRTELLAQAVKSKNMGSDTKEQVRNIKRQMPSMTSKEKNIVNHAAHRADQRMQAADNRRERLGAEKSPDTYAGKTDHKPDWRVENSGRGVKFFTTPTTEADRDASAKESLRRLKGQEANKAINKDKWDKIRALHKSKNGDYKHYPAKN